MNRGYFEDLIVDMEALDNLSENESILISKIRSAIEDTEVREKAEKRQSEILSCARSGDVEKLKTLYGKATSLVTSINLILLKGN
jgi:hypothetical protein